MIQGLYYEEHGSGAPILCIHGAGSSALMWAEAVEKLARLGRVIAYDRRGCSRSERPEPYERTRVADHADDAAGLLDALDAAPAVVIGRSYGGTVAMDLALRWILTENGPAIRAEVRRPGEWCAPGTRATADAARPVRARSTRRVRLLVTAGDSRAELREPWRRWPPPCPTPGWRASAAAT